MGILWTIYGPEYGQPGNISLYGAKYDDPVFVREVNPGNEKRDMKNNVELVETMSFK